jgi:hypothetical protein
VKKSHEYNVLSARECMHRGCTKKIKLRLVEIKGRRNADFCYEHEPKQRISGHSARGRS